MNKREKAVPLVETASAFSRIMYLGFFLGSLDPVPELGRRAPVLFLEASAQRCEIIEAARHSDIADLQISIGELSFDFLEL